MAGDDEPLTDSGWLARLLKLREPPTPPRRPKTIYYEAPEDPLVVLQRGHAGYDDVATCAQAVAIPSA